MMILKIAAGILAVGLVLIYLSPVVLRLLDPALTVIALIGVAMMLVDLWQSLQSKDD
jgi:hypothetical protein